MRRDAHLNRLAWGGPRDEDYLHDTDTVPSIADDNLAGRSRGHLRVHFLRHHIGW
jgi:hypothetical protein